MPTEYTHYIKDGISFKEFALKCARAFGACITMKEDPMDVEIPKFKPDTYYHKRLKATLKKWKELDNITVAEAELMAEEEYLREVE